jgi:hypothetical protein
MPPDRAQELAQIEAMIGQAEAQLAAHKLRLKHGGRTPNPSDPFDQIGCLKLWLAVLRGLRNDLLRAPQVEEADCALGKLWQAREPSRCTGRLLRRWSRFSQCLAAPHPPDLGPAAARVCRRD